MPSLAEEMRTIREEVFHEIGEVLLIGTVQVKGKFYDRPFDVPLADASVLAIQISFHCQYVEATVGALEEGDEVAIEGAGTYRFLRRIPDRGDESGRVVLELGTRL